MTLGEFIRQKREEKEPSFRKFAEKIGISAAHMNRIEYFDVIPSKEVLEKIAKGLDMDVSELEAIAKKME